MFQAQSLLIPLFLALTIFATRATIIERCAASLPYLDEWDSDAGRLLPAYAEGTISLHTLFASHNEHRPALTRLEGIAQYAIAGQWDPRMVMTINAAWWALTAGLLGAFILRITSPPIGLALTVLLLVAFALPADQENITWGFQSQHYLQALCAILSFIAALGYQKKSKRIILSLTLGIGLLSTAGGTLAAATVAVYFAVLAIAFREPLKPLLVPLVISIGWTFVGLALRVAVAGHDQLGAHSVWEFAAILVSCLNLPFIFTPWLFLIGWLPTALLLTALLTRRIPRTRLSDFSLLISAWVFLGAAAIAATRGNAMISGLPPSKYLTVLIFAPIGNALALAALVPDQALKMSRLVRWSFLLSWSAGFIFGYFQFASVINVQLQLKTRLESFRLALYTMYQRSENPAIFSNRTMFELGYPDPAPLVRRFRDPRVARVLPPLLQPGIEITWANAEAARTGTDLTLTSPYLQVLSSAIGESLKLVFAEKSGGPSLPYFLPGLGLVLQPPIFHFRPGRYHVSATLAAANGSLSIKLVPSNAASFFNEKILGNARRLTVGCGLVLLALIVGMASRLFFAEGSTAPASRDLASAHE